MYFVILAMMFRWTALFITGCALGWLLFLDGTVSDTLIILGFSVVMWLLAKGIDVIMKIPFQLKFLDTKKKRIIAAAASFAMGLLFALSEL